LLFLFNFINSVMYAILYCGKGLPIQGFGLNNPI
jgi:hypothetical protein